MSSLYNPLATQSISAAPSRATLEDPRPLTFISDAKYVQRIKEIGLECLGRLHGDLTFDDWMGVGKASEIIRAEVLAAIGALTWDPNNRRVVKEFNRRWDEFEASAGKNYKPLTKQERCALRELMTKPQIFAWRSTLTGPEKRRLNHPNAVLNRWRAHEKAKATPATDRKVSLYKQLEEANIKLQDDLHKLKKNSDGNLFSNNDTPKAIAIAVIGTFDGLANKTARIEAIARELNAWVKAQGMAAS